MKDYNAFFAPFQIYGVPFFQENHLMERLPRHIREALPSLEFFGRRTPGARLAFRTDSPRFELSISFRSIGPDVGMSIYACQSADVFVGGKYLGLATPPKTYDVPRCEGRFEKSSKMEDVFIWLPRNEIIESITVSVEDNAVIESPSPYRHTVPVVFYGSSITEGAHPSKIANCYNSILSRWLDFDFINLGFSGAAKGELAMADFINTLPMSVFVMDYDYNAPSPEHLSATHEPFYNRIREAHPDLPILILTNPNSDYRDSPARRDVIRVTYDHAVARGDQNVWFIDGALFYGDCDRDMCSADTVHPNDLGMYRMATAIRPYLEEALARSEAK